MTTTLFDPDLDGTPPGGGSARGPQDDDRRGGGGWPKGVDRKGGKEPEAASGMGLPNLIGIGLAAGFVASVPLVWALRRDSEADVAATLAVIQPPAVAIAPAGETTPKFRRAVDDDEGTPGAFARVELPDPNAVEAEAGAAATPEPEARHLAPPAAGVPPRPRARAGMAAVMDGLRRSAASTSWQHTGRPDPKLVAAIDAVLGEIRAATGDRSYDWPVRVGEIPPGLGINPVRVIHVTSREDRDDATGRGRTPLEAGRAVSAILLVDGDVSLTSAEDCLIAATGRVQVSYPSRCVILAGRDIEASHDQGSVLLAGTKVVVASTFARPGRPSHPPVYSGPELVHVSHASDVVFLNAKTLDVSHQTRCRPLDWAALDLGDDHGPPVATDRARPSPEAKPATRPAPKRRAQRVRNL